MVTQKVCNTRSTLLQETWHMSRTATLQCCNIHGSTVSYFLALTLLPATRLSQGEDALVQTVSSVAYLTWT